MFLVLANENFFVYLATNFDMAQTHWGISRKTKDVSYTRQYRGNRLIIFTFLVQQMLELLA